MIENEQECELKKQTTYVFHSRVRSAIEIFSVLLCVKHIFQQCKRSFWHTKACFWDHETVTFIQLSALVIHNLHRKTFLGTGMIAESFSKHLFGNENGNVHIEFVDLPTTHKHWLSSILWLSLIHI